MKLLTRSEYYGYEHIPPTGRVIVATNHMSRLDIPVLYMNPVREDITALVADKYQDYPLIKFIVDSGEGVWLDRSKADFSAFRKSMDLLDKGLALGISPEGTRSDGGKLLEGKPGTVLLALKSDTPIVPVGISGSDTGVSQLLHLKRPRLVARFGSSFRLEAIDRNDRNEVLKRYTDEVMCRIAVLLPERYHGFYAGHPRLKELIAEQGLVQD